jgi:hypothetical protein
LRSGFRKPIWPKFSVGRFNKQQKTTTDRIASIAAALEIPVDFFYDQTVGAERKAPDLSSAQRIDTLQSVLALRLLRAFQDMTDLRTKEVLILLADRQMSGQPARRRQLANCRVQTASRGANAPFPCTPLHCPSATAICAVPAADTSRRPA